MNWTIEDAIRETFADLLKSVYCSIDGKFEDKTFTIITQGNGEFEVLISKNGVPCEKRLITYKMEKI